MNNIEDKYKALSNEMLIENYVITFKRLKIVVLGHSSTYFLEPWDLLNTKQGKLMLKTFSYS